MGRLIIFMNTDTYLKNRITTQECKFRVIILNRTAF
jgi:hypothetical protein